LQSVHADILHIFIIPIVRITADDARLVDIEPAVALVETKQRKQLKEVHLLFDNHLLPGSACTMIHLSGKLLVAADELKKLLAQGGVPLHAEH